jgi:hypothetical protein
MPIESEFLELMPLTCELRPAAGLNRYGEQSYGNADSYFPRCHVQYTNKQMYGPNGYSFVEEGIVFLDDVYPVDTTWGLFIPQPGTTNRQVRIQSIDQNTDEAGFHHTAVHFGAL